MRKSHACFEGWRMGAETLSEAQLMSGDQAGSEAKDGVGT